MENYFLSDKFEFFEREKLSHLIIMTKFYENKTEEAA